MQNEVRGKKPETSNSSRGHCGFLNPARKNPRIKLLCITMHSTFLTFYKIFVKEGLSNAVGHRVQPSIHWMENRLLSVTKFRYIDSLPFITMKNVNKTKYYQCDFKAQCADNIKFICHNIVQV